MDRLRDRWAQRNAERRAKLIAELVKHGRCSEAAADKAVRALEIERPILDWLLKVDWLKLLELALKLLPLFLEDNPTTGAKPASYTAEPVTFDV